MCDSFRGDLQRRPTHPADLPYLVSAFPGIAPTLVSQVVSAMTDSLHPQITGVVAVLDTISRYAHGERETADGCGALLLFSAVGQDEAFTRYQSPEMALVHDALVTFNMAQRNVAMLNRVLAPYQMEITMLHCCGIALIERARTAEFQNSVFARDFNARRSLANCFGEVRGPESNVECIDDVPQETDLTQEQRNAYLRIAPIVASLARSNPFADLYMPAPMR